MTHEKVPPPIASHPGLIEVRQSEIVAPPAPPLENSKKFGMLNPVGTKVNGTLKTAV